MIVQTPVYNCFFSSIRNNGCRIVDNPLIRIDRNDGTFSYEMDLRASTPNGLTSQTSLTLMARSIRLRDVWSGHTILAIWSPAVLKAFEGDKRKCGSTVERCTAQTDTYEST